MKQIKTTEDVKQLGTILGIWAHPDDEVMTMCGILFTAINNGQTVICVTATRGEAGVQDEIRWPARKLGAIRGRELKAAYEILGIKEHHFLDYPDGGCHEVNENQAVQRIVSLIETYKPDSILTFGPDGLTGHIDHMAVSDWANKANKRASRQAKLYHTIVTIGQYEVLTDIDKKFNFFFNVERPKTCEDNECAIYLKLNDKQMDCKMKCLKAMPSQYEAVLGEFGSELRLGMGVEAFIEAK